MASFGEELCPDYDLLDVDISDLGAQGYHGVTIDTIIGTIWAITNHVYTGDDTVEFLRYGTDGQSTAVASMKYHVEGHMSAMEITGERRMSDHSERLVQDLRDDASVPSFSRLVKQAALLVTRADEIDVELKRHKLSSWGTLFHISVRGDAVRAILRFPNTPKWQDANFHLADTLGQVCRSISQDWETAISDMNFLGPSNLNCILQSTGVSAETANLTLADITTQQAKERPDRQAIDAWDGSFTYAELHHFSVQLAAILRARCISTEERIPLCMKKSKWTIVAMFGIFLAGGTCVPLDINSPRKRLEALIERLGARYVVTDKSTAQMFVDMDLSIISYPLEQAIICETQPKLPQISPSAAAFVYFTSGSTGVPKGVVLEHGNLYSAILEVAKGYNLDEKSRVFQYAAYVFDVSMGDNFGTLMNGGCLCIPSEEARMDNLSATVNGFAVTHACFTNTVISQIQPDKVPTLQHLFVGGEALDKAQFLRWNRHVDFNVVYGTTESLIWDSLATAEDLKLDYNNIGRPIGPCMWVVDTRDPEQMRPIGAIGEILIEGPLLARGYMDDPNTTAMRFILAPMWMRQLRRNPQLRCYRTGDIGYRNSDGSVSFTGRADTQVKIRGQRVELGEIEHSIRLAEPLLELVAVEAVVIPSRDNTKTLAAFIRIAEADDTAGPILTMDDRSKESFFQVQLALADTLPQHMVPSLLFPIRKTPRAVTGKLDRKTLRQWASSLNSDDLAQYYLSDSSTFRAPETAEEKLLQQVWARTFKLSVAKVGADDHFFQIGGDSIKAMQLVAALRESGKILSVADVFRAPRLCEMAAALGEAKSPVTEVEGAGAPFDLLPEDAGVEVCVREAAQACQVNSDLVEDIYPATPMQEALMAISAHRTSAYHYQAVFRLPESLDVQRFKSAWETLVLAQPILRTRIFFRPGTGSLQVVLRSGVTWGTGSSLEKYVEQSWAREMTHGTELSRYAIVHDDNDGLLYFVWSGHHAIYDGWSQPMMFDEICRCYEDGHVSLQVPYRRFIRYLSDLDVEEAASFWQGQFPDVSESALRLPSAGYVPQPERITSLDIGLESRTGSTITTATVIQAAWAVVMARHAGTDDTVFGLTLSGRDAPVAGVTNMLGPTITTVPLRINLDNTKTVAEFLHDVQAQVSQVRLHQHFGLQRIRRLSPEARSAADFQSLLVIHPGDFEQDQNLSELGLQLVRVEETDTRDLALTIQCVIDDSVLRIRAQYDDKVVAEGQLESLLHQLEHVASQLAKESTSMTIYDLDMMSTYDLKRLATWNAVMPPPVAASIHSLVEERAIATPHAKATCGSDGEYTYMELNAMADKLADHLFKIGIRTEVRVVLCFTKSTWPIISMLAVLKCGGVCVSVNPDHPLPRLLEICEDVEAKVLLCDNKSVSQFTGHVPHVVAVDASLLTQLESQTGQHRTSVLPSNAAFIVYTSGSTGKPKGSVLEHQALCTSLNVIGEKSDMNAGTRTLQFSAYTFDAHILEIFGTLIHGGCICVISDSERMNNLAGIINDRQVNWSLLTPTVARLLTPGDIPSMKTLILSGEPLAQQDIQKWAGQVRLLNGLGPSECSILACITDTLTAESEPSNIGHAIGCHLWITNPRRPDRLLPIGSSGELTIEGPILGREYVNRAKATAAAFITDPAWSRGKSDRSRRFYRTGDLAKFNQDGSVNFIGRADTQVKIRGQRVELSEIEHNLKIHGPTFAGVVVEVLTISSRGDTQTLAAFISCRGAATVGDGDGPVLTMNSRLKDDFTRAQEALTTRLPRYMVPSMFLPIRNLPVSASGKLERKTLRGWVSALSGDELAQYYLTSSTVSSQPTTENEKRLLQLWAQVLKVPKNTIGTSDNFFQLGGDSVMAMELIAAARTLELSLTVAEVFQSPQLVEMAKHLRESTNVSALPATIEAFSLVQEKVDLATCIEEAAQECQVGADFVEDIYPCTPIQEALMAISSHRPRAYTHQAVFKLPRTMDLNRFKLAWEAFVSTQAIFRTRIVVQQGIGSLQVVLNTKITWRTGTSLEQYLKLDRGEPIEYGGDLSRFAIVEQQDESVFVWTLHHATYDGWSLSKVFEEVGRNYRSEAAKPVVPYNQFIRYLATIDVTDSDEFWRGQFPDITEAFPRLPSTDYTARPRQRKTATMKLSRKTGTATTMASVILAAWALVTAPYTDGNQAHFGLTLSGRDAAVAGIPEIMGPTITTVPLRIGLDYTEGVTDFLQRVQAQVTLIRKYQHTGLQRIRRLSPEAWAAVDFQSLLVIQNVGDEEISAPLSALGLQAIDYEEDEFLDLALTTECIIRQDALHVNIQYDNHVVADKQVDFLLCQLEHTLSLLLGPSQGTSLQDLNLMSPYDLQQLALWNKETPDTVAATVHGLVEMQVLATPDAVAISGFDGEHTYAELDTMASTLAAHLVDCGVGLEVQVVLCFAKSSWPIVAMLAVLKSGGVCVSVNPQHPSARLLDICRDAAPAVVLCDADGVDRFVGHVPHVVAVDSASLTRLKASQTIWVPPAVLRSSAAFTVYTSGSTGMPKGTVLEHQSLCTSIIINGGETKLNPRTRALQFSAYTFDLHILEIFGTLIHGGCVCVISEDERVSALSEIMNQRQVNWALLTPTVARLLPGKGISTLETLVLAGESIGKTDLQQWAGRVRLLNGFGPSECSILVCVSSALTKESDPSDIGRATGCHIWITDRQRPDRLMPIGCIGEMLVEGPIVGREYLNRPKTTAAAFITDPVWSRDGSGRSRRFYRTGDLAKLNPDGSLIFIGRADTQVKIRGQRVELGEIEHQIRDRLPPGSEVVVEVVTAGDSAGRSTLAAFIRLDALVQAVSAQPINGEDQSFISLLTPSTRQSLQTRIADLERSLGDSLPEYMVPAVYIPVSSIPTTPSGKTDRGRLRQHAQSLTRDEMCIRNSSSEKRQPTEEIQRELQSIWSRVLNYPTTSIGIDDTFTSLGGDSITAMQVVADCRKRGVKVSVSVILGKKTILNIAPLCVKRKFETVQAPTTLDKSLFDLSPIQRLYFAKESQKPTQFNQSFLLRVLHKVSASQVQMALNVIVERHAMLRARFTYLDGQWKQGVVAPTPDCYRFLSHDVGDISKDIEPRTQESSCSLDVVKGPVFSVDFFNIATGDAMIFMIAHHLIIDLVSWRIIWRDLEEVLRGSTLSGTSSLSFRRWCELQEANQIAEGSTTQVLPPSTPASNYAFWQVPECDNVLAAVVTKSFDLTAETTKLLLGKSNDTLRTVPVDILLGLLLTSFRATFVERDVPAAFVEHHGREPWDTDEDIDIDIEQTVGWFTTMYPLYAPITPTTTAVEAIRLVKDKRYAVPGNGRPYFARRYLSAEGAEQLQQHDPAELLVNFAGVFQQLEDKDGLIELESRVQVQNSESASNIHRWALIDLSIEVSRGIMTFQFSLHRDMAHLERVRHFVDSYRDLLLENAPKLARQSALYTLSDFPLLNLTYSELDDMIINQLPRLGINSADEIQDIYPCTAMQEGILLSQQKNDGLYQVTVVWEFKKPGVAGDSLSAQVREVWQSLVERHSNLRTEVVQVASSRGSFLQVVLKNVCPRFFEAEQRVSGAAEVAGLPLMDEDGASSHIPRLTLYRMHDGRAACRLGLSHVMLDGMSVDMLISEFVDRMIDQPSPSPVTEFGRFVEYERKLNGAEDMEYWTNYLSGAESCQIVPLRRTGPPMPGYATFEVSIEATKNIASFCKRSEVTPAALLQTAWAIVLGTFTGQEDVCLGYFASSRDAPLDGIENSIGLFISMQVCRVRLTGTTDEVLHCVQEDIISGLGHRNCSLASIHSALGFTTTPLFNTCMTVRRALNSVQDARVADLIDVLEQPDRTEYPVALNATVSPSEVSCAFTYQLSEIPTEYAEKIGGSLETVIRCLTTGANQQIATIDRLGPNDYAQIEQWTAQPPSVVAATIHELVEKQVLVKPDAIATSGFDGEYTYAELNAMSNTLAKYLMSLGLRSESRVLLCFSKSTWPVIAMLAVLKSGGVCVSVNPEHPLSRLLEICEDVKAAVVLCDQGNVSKFSDHSSNVVSVNAASLAQLESSSSLVRPTVYPNNAAFVVYTSGTTGKPKGSVLEHQSLCTSLAITAKKSGMDSAQTRTLQFSAYTFDAHILEIFGTLIHGGCVCIISDSERMDRLADTIMERQANWSLLTPTVARLLSPTDIPMLKTLILAGEPLAQQDIQKWASKVRLLNGIGPSECSILACLADSLTVESQPSNIGYAIGCHLWITDRYSPDRLVPVGCIGEVLIEGPIVGREYVNRPEATAAAFITGPAWSRKGYGTPRRFYRTGDLARFNSDGSITFLGRRDTQVKIRGQRVELGEIEHHLKAAQPSLQQVAVEVGTLPNQSDSQVLVAFISYADHRHSHSPDSEGEFPQISDQRRQGLVEVRQALRSSLPLYMVPTMFIPVRRLPYSASGKLDRTTLRQWLTTFDVDQLARYSLSDVAASRPPETAAEKLLQHAWAKTLGVPTAGVGAEDHFFQTGGDSVKAMELVAVLRELGKMLSVAEVFRTPRLYEMATVLKEVQSTKTDSILKPFALIRDRTKIDSCVREAAQICQVDGDMVEDIYPATPMQEALVAISTYRTGAYHHQVVFKLPGSIDLERFKTAWQTLVSAQPIFRTRIVLVPGLGSLQVVLRSDITWHASSSLQECLKQDKDIPMANGAELSRFAIVDEDSELTFVWTVHHALYDGWSLSRVFDEVSQIYKGRAMRTVVPYSNFIRYLGDVDMDMSDKFWRDQFPHVTETYPQLPSAGYVPRPHQMKSSVVNLGRKADTKVTLATVIQAAWALVTAQRTGAGEALFGLTLSGRDAPVPGITQVMGPTLATVPIRVQIKPAQSIADFLQGVQEQVNLIRRYQHTGLQRIRSLSPGAKAAVNIQNLLTIQTPGDVENSPSLEALGLQAVVHEEQDFLDLVLTMECVVRPDAIDLRVQYDRNVVADEQIESLLRQLKHTISLLLEQSQNVLVDDLDLMSSHDLRQLTTWNSAVPEIVSTTLHELVEKQVLARPDAIATSGFDGQYTYAELSAIATKLATYLTDIGVQQESRALLCFAKSTWPIVAMLAVLKSGGVCVSVNPEHPSRRLIEICEDVEAAVVLCDNAATAARFSSHVAYAVIVDASLMAQLGHHGGWMQPSVLPSNAAFVVYTSGSTGKPKGSVLEHQALCTSLTAIGNRSDMDTKTRTLQFSAYTFDVHLLEIFGTLVHGGCICVISDSERMNRLTEVINDRQMNWSLLTPTVARLLTTESTLKTLILSGEPPIQEDIQKWAGPVRLLNGLGPSECSILACLTGTLTPEDHPSNIGHPIGCHLWITDRRCPDRLVPIGCIGELVVEGPIIGREYINRPEATAAAFVKDLAWSRNGSSRSSRRFYRSGDLAKFNPDGSVTYIGRADTQVKIRGQRVELGEIEHQIRQRLPRGSEAVVELITAGDNVTESTLAAFIQLGATRQDPQTVNVKDTDTISEPADKPEHSFAVEDIDPQMQSKAQTAVDDLRNSLGDTLPEYMVPAAYIPVSFIPTTPSGKTDRRRLRDYAQGLTRDKMYMRNLDSKKQEPTNEIQHELRSIWARILNCPEADISTDDSFTSLGGDSITAMQAVAECRKKGIKITVSVILGKKTILKIAPYCVKKAFETTQTAVVLDQTSFDLSPVQKLYFAKESQTWTQFNQSFLLRLRRKVSADELRHAFNAIVDRHAMLRARFTRGEGEKWKQNIVPTVAGCYRFESNSISDVAKEIEPWTQKSSSSLNIVEGPVFSIDFFEISSENSMMFMVAHHLVVDLVSWRVIWRDLEEVLRGVPLSNVPTLSFRRWCELQEAHCKSQETIEQVLPLPTPPSGYAFWQVDERNNTLAETIEESFSLTADVTSLILGRSNDSLRTAPLDIMLGLLVMSFRAIFAERDVPSVFVEQHGREPWDTDQDIDIGQTVGWFTTMYPLYAPVTSSTTAVEAIRLVKDKRHTVPANGRPYFACRHLLPEGARQFQKHDPAEILLNFAGVFQQLEVQDSLVELESRLEVQNSESEPSVHRWALIDLNVKVSHGIMNFSFDLHRGMAHLGRVREWIRLYKDLLSEHAMKLADRQRTFTLSDFPLLDLSYTELDDVLASRCDSDNIRNILPLTAFQKMVIEGNLEDPPKHWDSLFLELPKTVDIPQLRNTCIQLVKQFDSLRTVFIKSRNELLQIVLENMDPRIDLYEVDEGIDVVVERLCYEDLTEPRSLGSSFVRFMIVRTPDHVRLIMRLSHAQYDGMCLGAFAATFAALYDGKEVRESCGFAEYIRHCRNQNRKGYAHWRSLLDGSALTNVPQITLQAGQHGSGTTRVNKTVPPFAEVKGLTQATVFSAACAMLLASMTESSDVVFGRFVSGRAGLDSAIQGLIGPCVNIVPVRVKVSTDVNSVLQSVQKQYIESIEHETVGMDEIVQNCTDWSASTTRFPVIVQFRNYDTNSETEIAGSSFRLSGWDQTHVHPFPQSLCIGAYPVKGEVKISVSAGAAFCSHIDLEQITEELCKILGSITRVNGM